MAPHSCTLAWKIPWTEEPGTLQCMGLLRVGTTKWLHFHFSLLCIGEGNSNSLQCSCLENPREEGAWWAAIYGVAQSRTRLIRLWSRSSSSSSHRYAFSTRHIWMWELHRKEGWVPKNWCLWIVLEKTLESRTARRSSQSILKKINPESSLEGLMMKLKL